MIKRAILKAISLLVVFCLLIPLTAPLANAVAAQESEATEMLTLTAEDIPEYLSYDAVIAAGHVQRLYAQEEELNTVVFHNSDATETVYLFNEDIKYVGSDGIVYDKSNHLTRQIDGSYRNHSNDIQVTYPAKISDGIVVSKGNVSLHMIPAFVNDTPVITPTDGSTDTVYYAKAFGSNTALRYTQTFTGFKEDILLIDKQDMNSFSFTVLTNGAVIELRNGLPTVTLAGSIQGTFGTVYAYDANGAMVYGEISISEVTPNQKYTLTISVPADFLNAESTIYPVTIDPTLTLNDTTTTKIIEDATVYTNYSSNWGTQSSLFVGDFYMATGFTRGEAYSLIKFPLLNSNNTFKTRFNAGRITSIKLNFAEVICGFTNTIRAYRVTKAWDEATVVYNDVKDNLLGYPTSSALTITATNASPPYPRYELEILPLVERSGLSEIASMGIVLKPTSTNRPALTIGSSESGSAGGRTDSKPYVTYTYYAMPTSQTAGIFDGAVYQIVNVETGKAISYTTALSQQTANAALASQRFRITYEEDGGYRIKSEYNTDNPLYTDKYLQGINSTLSAANYSDNYSQQWYIVPVDGGYRLHNVSMENNVVSTQDSTSSLYLLNSPAGSVWELRLVYLDVPLIEQTTDYTCSAAAGLMLLNYYGCTSVTESQFYARGSVVYQITSSLNYYLNNDPTHTYTAYSNVSQLTTILTNCISSGHPAIINILITTQTAPLPYIVPNGHYIVITGIYYDSSASIYKVVANDPHDDHSAVYEFDINLFFSAYMNPDNQFVISAT